MIFIIDFFRLFYSNEGIQYEGIRARSGVSFSESSRHNPKLAL
jgi:hypothetical protein